MADPTVEELKAMGLCGPDVMSVRDMLSRGYGESESSARALMDFVNDNTNGFFGIEELRDTDPDGESVLLCLYLNSGDTYDTTLCWVPGEGFVVASWGDIYEEWERGHCEEDHYRCAYCGEWQQCGEAVSAADDVYNCESYHCPSCCEKHCGCGGDGEAAYADEE